MFNLKKSKKSLNIPEIHTRVVVENNDQYNEYVNKLKKKQVHFIHFVNKNRSIKLIEEVINYQIKRKLGVRINQSKIEKPIKKMYIFNFIPEEITQNPSLYAQIRAIGITIIFPVRKDDKLSQMLE